MSQSLIRILEVQPRYTSTGKLSSYSVECFHDGLKEHRELKSSELDVLQNKVVSLLERWDEKWQRACDRHDKQRSAFSAAEATKEAQQALAECSQILISGIEHQVGVDWEALKHLKPFVSTAKKLSTLVYIDRNVQPIGILNPSRPAEPMKTDLNFKADLKFIDYLIPFLKNKKIAKAERDFSASYTRYQEDLKEFNFEKKRRENSLEEAKLNFTREESAYEEKCFDFNSKIDALRDSWQSKVPAAVVEYAELVLEASKYPDWFHPDFSTNYVSESGLLLIDFQLPNPTDIPTLEKVLYVKSRNELSEKHLADSKARKLFDDICYQIALRTIYELFVNDEPDSIKSIALNGWVHAINSATGVSHRSCILSIHVFKDDFLALDLTNVDPKACFRALRGVSASSLHQITPVRPVISLERNDPRFVDSYAVADSLDESVNLAAMSWEDFEHLVRELFGKAFSGNGAEVRVTQASRDGGVDAIVLDPDPIRGGKIIIQAKRYTATVGVASVRDLYGTVVNEGANRGILVTTSDFGPDAYKFAAGKPITLLNGSNLLALLEEHGHKARIDIQEARTLR